MDDKPKKIIIKRVKKAHAESHGGSWKVAYADFVTAMMAFFLLMWLLNMSSPEKRAVLAMYFRHFSLFEKGGKSFMQEGGERSSGQQNFGGEEVVETGEHSSGITNDDLATKLMTGIDQNVQVGKEQFFIAITDEGVRIQIVDSVENPIFASGSAQLSDSAKKIVRAVALVLKNFPNEIGVEGHTDSSPVRSEQVSNWELSVARASSARRELEQAGISPTRIARVVGYADKVPLFTTSPDDPRNRRISILFMKNSKIKPPDRLDWLLKKPPS